MKKILLWIRICRPQTLFASLVPVLVALLICGVPSGVAAVVTACCSLTLQILSNLINDYYDFKRGTDKAGRAGFKRALAEGEVSERAMRTACFTAAGGACVLGAYLVWTGGLVVLAIGLSALLFAWLYTATSKSLSYLGIADIFVFLYYGVVASCGTAYIQQCAAEGGVGVLGITSVSLPVMVRVFCAGGVSGLISSIVLMVNNLRDMESDRAAGKRTVPVRFGKRFGEMVILVYALFMPLYAMIAFGSSDIANGELPLTYCPPMLIVIPAISLWHKICRAKGAEYNKCLLLTGMMNVVYFLLCCVI